MRLLALLTLLVGRADCQVAAYHHWRTLDTPHFHIHVAEGLEREGRVAGAAAERAYALLAKELKEPRGPVDLLVSDDADFSNGYATPLPTNRIVVFASPPVEGTALRFNEDWLALVITHELTHIFHLDRADGIWAVVQGVLGRVPGSFPNQYGPAWLTEGLAVYYESRLTETGRLKDSEHTLFARAAAQEHEFPGLYDLSLGSPIFPGGAGAYAYGSLLVDYLARSRGDTTIAKLVNAQSRALIPLRLNHIAEQSLGISFRDAYTTWSDSVKRSAGEARPPLPGWRELTTHNYTASNPRWITDSTLVYASADGRTSAAAYELTMNGDRRRIGRRNSLGPSVPLADGSLLFAQLDYDGPVEIRSDLYVEKDGVQRRLTHGLRLISPDVRRDGTIVAVQLAPARANLVLVDSRGRDLRVMRTAEADETWTEPRWSPDGRAIAVVHRPHGKTYSLEVIDVATDTARVLDRGSFVMSTPAWTPDGRRVLYTSQASGIPLLTSARVDQPELHTPIPSDNGTTGVYSADVSPNGRSLAAVSLRAQGNHVGVAPMRTVDSLLQNSELVRLPPAPAIDSQPLAPGDYESYSAFPSLLPHYWEPILEPSPDGSRRLGVFTSGQDIIGRHSYSAFAAMPTSGSFPVAAFAYRFAGLKRALIDVQASQDYTKDGNIFGASNALLGSLLRRSQDASIAATFTRPRERTYSSLSFGAGIERRHFATDPDALLFQLSDTSFRLGYYYPRAFVGGQWSNVQRPGLSISGEDGVSVAFTARERYRTDIASSSASASLIATSAGFRSLDLGAFAHHVLAMRIAAGVADRKAATALEVGGISGTTIELVPGYIVGEGRRTFGVRGFPAATIYGTSALAGSLEFRAPLALGGHGLGTFPFFFDRASLTAFADGGVATCATSPLYAGICAPAPRIGRTIASVGSEAVLSAAVLDWDFPQTFRIGFAVAVAGRDLIQRGASAYVAYGLSF